jgi:hypothetical protein
MTMLDKLKRTLTPISLQVNYGPNKGSAVYRAQGDGAWHCNPCALAGKEPGRICRSIDEAKRAAERHAQAHRGAQVVYYEG